MLKDDGLDATPAMVLRWLLDVELQGALAGLTAVAALKDGSVRYIALHGAPGAIETLSTTEQELPCHTLKAPQR